jgi:hypothetical protein
MNLHNSLPENVNNGSLQNPEGQLRKVKTLSKLIKPVQKIFAHPLGYPLLSFKLRQ